MRKELWQKFVPRAWSGLHNHKLSERVTYACREQGSWPAARCSHTAAAIGSTIYIQGGSFYRHVQQTPVEMQHQ